LQLRWVVSDGILNFVLDDVTWLGQDVGLEAYGRGALVICCGVEYGMLQGERVAVIN